MSRKRLKIENKLSDIGAKLKIGSGTFKPKALDGTETDEEITIHQYKTYRWKKMVFILGFIGLFILLLGMELGSGDYDVPLVDVYTILINHIFFGEEIDTLKETVVWNFRATRVFTAIFVGVGLAIAGCAMQSMMKNPLADPFTTGVSSGAAFGATLAITMGIYIIPGVQGQVINAFVFALMPAMFIIALSKFKKPSPSMMILCGIALMYIFNALQSYMMLMADPRSAAQVYSWTVGSITSTTWDEIWYVIGASMAGLVVLLYMSRMLNTLNSGDAYAKSLGINVDHVRIAILLTVSLVTAGIVSFTGIIGFIGLVAPHIARIFVGSDNKILIPVSALLGACLMMFSDLVIQLFCPTALPVGLITSLIGGPMFMILLISQKKEVW